jgi:hypothetical protein
MSQLPTDVELLKRMMLRLDETIEYFDRLRQRHQALLSKARKASTDSSVAASLEQMRIEAEIVSTREAVQGAPPADLFQPYLDQEKMRTAINDFRAAAGQIQRIRAEGFQDTSRSEVLDQYERLVDACSGLVACHRDLQRSVVRALQRMTGETPKQTGCRLRDERIQLLATRVPDQDRRYADTSYVTR